MECISIVMKDDKIVYEIYYYHRGTYILIPYNIFSNEPIKEAYDYESLIALLNNNDYTTILQK